MAPSSAASILCLSSGVSLPSLSTAARMLARRASRRLAASRAASSARSSVSSMPPVLSLRYRATNGMVLPSLKSAIAPATRHRSILSKVAHLFTMVCCASAESEVASRTR